MNPTALAPSSLARGLRSACGLAATSLLIACAGPAGTSVPTVYDFGPAADLARNAETSPVPAIALASVDAPLAQQTPALQYRLSYANPQALRPYGLARWSMPPGQLVQQRLRAKLASQGPVVDFGQAGAAFALQVSLEEFSQQFDSASSSQGVVQLRATLFKGNALVAQRNFAAQAPAATADAAGGARALTLATDEAVQALANWVAAQAR